LDALAVTEYAAPADGCTRTVPPGVNPAPLTEQLPPPDGQLMEVVADAANAGEADQAKAAIPLKLADRRAAAASRLRMDDRKGMA